MKTSSRMIFLFLVSLTLLIQACASSYITRKDLEPIKTIQVVSYKTPDFNIKTLAGVILVFSGGYVTAPLGMHLDEKASEAARQGTIFPDYGDLLVQSFMRIAPKEIQGWPKMGREKGPVERSYEYKDGATIIFDVNHIWLTLYGGLTIEGDMIMRNPQESKILERHFWYRSVDFGLLKTQEEYTANNCKLLIEEVPLAAEHTVRKLIIEPLKQGL